MARKNNGFYINNERIEQSILIPLKEYKELLIIKGRYEAIKETNAFFTIEDKSNILNCKEGE